MRNTRNGRPCWVRQDGQGKPPSGLHFAFSTFVPPADTDWCAKDFHEAIRINPTPGNANSRLFALGSGLHRIVVEGGGQSSAFMLKKISDQTVEVFTSVNFANCVSNRIKFTIESDGTLHYDNGRLIKFTATLSQQTNGTVVSLETAPGAGYGFLVHRCDNCE